MGSLILRSVVTSQKTISCWVKFLVVSSQLDVHNCPSGPTVNKSSGLGSNITSKGLLLQTNNAQVAFRCFVVGSQFGRLGSATIYSDDSSWPHQEEEGRDRNLRLSILC